MKQSKYNFFYKIENDRYIAFNALKDGLAAVGSKTVDKVLALNPGDTIDIDETIRQELVRGGFICEDDLDEFSTIIIRKNMQQYNSTILGLVIAPTLACNLGCIYCFESPSQGIMNDKVMEALITFVKKHIDSGIKRLAVTWYGGEPLLGIDVIEKLSEKFIALCEENKINYSAFIITNGTLYTKDTAEKLKNLKVNGAQITLDGDKAIHDQRRPFKNGNGTFDQILKNIRETADILPIGIRVNVDKTNIDQTFSFFEKRANVWDERDLMPERALRR
ncbi:MAG: radical SAM protein [Acidobacteria bacterium]|nr:radical SAM protein [Acidobacteriota bacterium]